MKLDYLFIGAHPDDCEIMAGGTILKLIDENKKVGVIDLTRGELGSNGSVAIRKKEMLAVSKIANLTHRECLGLKDGFLDSSKKNIYKVVLAIRKYTPEIIFTFKSDNRHPDHEEAHKLVKKATFLAGLKNYEKKIKFKFFRPSALIYFGEPYHFSGKPNFFVDVSKYYTDKIKMIECYSTQVAVKQKSVENKTLLGSPLFWNALKGKEMSFGALIGSEYAEGFWSENPMQLYDPIQNFIKPVK